MNFRAVLVGIFALISLRSAATHIRSAEIRVERITCDTRTVKITVIVFLDSRSSTPFGGFNLADGHIDFGDGSIRIIPEIAATPRPDLGKDISVASFTVNHTYTQNGTYKINYYERDRSQGVLNMTNPGDTAYSSSTTITFSEEAGCNRFPTLAIAPVDRACPGKKFFHNAGATDADGDSLSYSLTIPARDAFNPVFGYISPDDPRFYTNHATGNEAANGPPTFTIDAETGLITWDAPGRIGEFNIAFQIQEWRKNQVTGLYTLLSTTVRDMQILVEECANQRPDITIPSNICVVAGTTITAEILGFDPDNDPVKIEAVSEIFNLPPEKIPATIYPTIPGFEPSNPPATADFEWTTDCVHVRDQPYQVIIKITDQPRFGTQLVTFKTWTIKVIGPQPEWRESGLDLVNRNAVLQWEDYPCQNAAAIQVWRKVGSASYTPDVCGGGLPRFIGYQLIAEVDPSNSTYTDTNGGKGLSAGAYYCYRIVAAFPLPAGGKSYVSDEICVGPIEADAPVITTVTVVNTHHENGKVRVSWRSPFEINKVQFPEPYQYEVYRGDGFSGEDNLLNASGRMADTTFLDEALNTEEQVYNYRIVVYAKPQGATIVVPVDTSATASSVRLEGVPEANQITLSWAMEVPWSNVVPVSPWHYIYRGEDIEDDAEMELVDSVDVTIDGFVYTDTGLNGETVYSYRIETLGTYGNPAIAPIKNFSQVITLYPENTLLPCPPTAHAAPSDCETFLLTESCNQDQFSASLSWSPTLDDGCRRDIVSYIVFGADGPEGEFSQVATVNRDTVFTETGLTSFARCYRIKAVDAVGNISEWSEPTCTENCTNFQLPNVFTPNGDGCNDVFSAYAAVDDSGTTEDCNRASNTSCPRFVEHVTFVVYNRWGRPLYTYTSSDTKPVSIDWDGRDDHGNLLDASTYFYVADVTFNVIDPTRRKRKYKGWVQLLR